MWQVNRESITLIVPDFFTMYHPLSIIQAGAPAGRREVGQRQAVVGANARPAKSRRPCFKPPKAQGPGKYRWRQRFSPASVHSRVIAKHQTDRPQDLARLWYTQTFGAFARTRGLLCFDKGHLHVSRTPSDSIHYPPFLAQAQSLQNDLNQRDRRLQLADVNRKKIEVRNVNLP